MAREHSKKGTEKHLNLQCKQCAREQEPKVDGTVERVPVGVYRSTSIAVRVKEERIVLARDSGPRPEARMEEKGKRKVAKVTPESAGAVVKTGHIAANCVKVNWNRSLNAVEEDEGDISEEVREGEDELHAWCLLEESENEQWQEVTSKKSKLQGKKFAHVSLLSVEDNSCASPRQVLEVKDNWVSVGATMETGSAGHVMPAEMFPRVKLDRTSTIKKFLAANGETIKDLGEKTIPFKSVEGYRSVKFRSANVVKPLISMRKVLQAGNVVVRDEKNPHIRGNRDGTVIKLDVNNEVYTMDIWLCFHETGPVFSSQGQ